MSFATEQSVKIRHGNDPVWISRRDEVISHLQEGVSSVYL